MQIFPSSEFGASNRRHISKLLAQLNAPYFLKKLTRTVITDFLMFSNNHNIGDGITMDVQLSFLEAIAPTTNRDGNWRLRERSSGSAHLSQLIEQGRIAEAWSALSTRSWEEQAEALSMPDVVRQLAVHGLVEAAWDRITKFDRPATVAVLAAPGAVSGLAYKGKADAVWREILRVDRSDKLRVLSADEAVFGLTQHGLAEAVRDVFDVLLVSERIEILCASRAAWGLADSKEGADRVWKALTWAEPREQARILAAAGTRPALEMYGYGFPIRKLLDKAKGRSQAASPHPQI